MRPRLMIRLIISCIMLCVFSSCSPAHVYRGYEGRVLELGTEKPIEGAAVLVTYMKKMPNPGGATYYFADAQETLTDAEGRFDIPMNIVGNINFLTFFEGDPHIIIFKPGYGCYPRHDGIKTKTTFEYRSFPHEPVTIWLPSVRGESRDNKLWNTHCDPSPNVPEDKYPNLLRLMREDSEMIFKGRH